MKTLHAHSNTFAVPVVTRRAAAMLAVLALLIPGPAVLAQSDDFNDGNDAGWTHFDLAAVGLNGAEYTFPDVGAGDKAYRVHAPAPVADVGAPALSITYRGTPDYTRFQISVDVLDWASGVNQAYGIFARASDIGFPTIDGYVMNYNVADGDLQINEITDLGGQDTRAEVPVGLTPGTTRYRWVFSGYDNNFLGQVFALPDAANPIASVTGSGVVAYAEGKGGLFVFNRDGAPHDAAAKIADATFDNYSAVAPAAGSLRATAIELQPQPNGVARAIPVPIKLAILDRETTVNADSVILTVDGQVIPRSNLTIENQVVVPNNTELLAGVTITYTNASVASLTGLHTNRVTFQDDTGTSQTNEWTYSFAYLPARNSTPPGSGRDPGFAVRLVQSIANQPLANSLSRAEQQLAVPPQIAIDLTTNTTVSVINYTQNPVPNDPPSADGHFEDFATFPGIDAAGNTEDIAMEVLAYLELPAGTHTFGVTSDDGFQLRSGVSPTDPGALVLAEKASGTFDGTFDIIAEQAGVYPFRLVWFERGGGAHVELFTVDRVSGERTLVNAATSPVKAFQSVVAPPSVVLQSSPSVLAAEFQNDSSAVVNTDTKTITTAQSGGQRFYRLQSGAALRILTTRVSGGTVTLTYE
jgi:hypothetical protein